MSCNVIQMSRGSNTLWEDTVLLMNMESYPPVDVRGHTVTSNGVTQDNSRYKFGNRSVRFGNHSTYLSIENKDDLFFGGGDFTIEAWVYASSALAYGFVVLGRWGIGPNVGTDFLFHILKNGQVGFVGGDVEYYAPPTAFLYNSTWQFMTVERYNGNIYLYRNGVLLGSTPITKSLSNDPLMPMRMGIFDDATSGFAGNIDEMRVTRQARYKGQNFAVPTAAFAINT